MSDNYIPYGQQWLDDDDIAEVVKTLRSDYLTTGPKVGEFEEKLADYVGSKYAVAVSSGTAALHAACFAAGISKGDEVITTPMTFAASANCILYCGARPVFADIQEDTANIDPEEVRRKINKKTKAIIPVHYGGNPCDLDEIHNISKEYRLIVIEDACHALGAMYKGKKIGGLSEMTVFSFHPVKHITTGEGGMVTTNSKEIYEKLLMFRHHGITKDSRKFTQKDEAPWYYEMQELGFNYRITDFQCALGISQLNKIDKFIEKRRGIDRRYDDAFENNEDIEVIKDGVDCFNAYHLYVIRVKDKEIRLRLFNYLEKNDVFCQVHYIPVYWHPFYRKRGYKNGICPNAEAFYERIISLPIYYGLKEDEQIKTIELIKRFF